MFHLSSSHLRGHLKVWIKITKFGLQVGDKSGLKDRKHRKQVGSITISGKLLLVVYRSRGTINGVREEREKKEKIIEETK